MASEATASLQVFPYSGSAGEQSELARWAEEWRHGTQPFWPEAEVLATLQSEHSHAYYAATTVHGAWAGFALIGGAEELVDLLYLFVPLSQRRRGIGRLLLQHLLAEMQRLTPAAAMMLEVRPSNTEALALYQACGFRQIAKRKNYYAGGEDALVLKHPGLVAP